MRTHLSRIRKPLLSLLMGVLSLSALTVAGCSKEAPPESKDYYTGPLAPKATPPAGKPASRGEKVE